MSAEQDWLLQTNMLAYGVRGVAPWLALVAMAIAAAGLAAT